MNIKFNLHFLFLKSSVLHDFKHSFVSTFWYKYSSGHVSFFEDSVVIYVSLYFKYSSGIVSFFEDSVVLINSEIGVESKFCVTILYKFSVTILCKFSVVYL